MTNPIPVACAAADNKKMICIQSGGQFSKPLVYGFCPAASIAATRIHEPTSSETAPAGRTKMNAARHKRVTTATMAASRTKVLRMI